MEIKDGICILTDKEAAVSGLDAAFFVRDFEPGKLLDLIYTRERSLLGLCVTAEGYGREFERLDFERGIVENMVEQARTIRE